MCILHNSVMWRDSANHTAPATFSCCHDDESHTKSSAEQHLWRTHLLTNRTKWQLTAERLFLEICVRFGRPPVSSILWLSLHMPGLYVSTWTTRDSQHLFPEMIQRSRQSVFWWVDLGVVFACLSIVFFAIIMRLSAIAFEQNTQ